MPSNEDSLREVERTVLDTHYQRFDILKAQANDAIYAVLRVYGNVSSRRFDASVAGQGCDVLWLETNANMRAIAHCVRWIRNHCPRSIRISGGRNENIMRDAHAFLRWGSDYETLQNQHKAFGSRIDKKRCVEAVVDLDRKTISFRSPEHVDPRFYLSQVKAKKVLDAKRQEAFPERRVVELSTSWLASITSVNDPHAVDDSTILSGGALCVALEWFREYFLPECDDEIGFGRFTMGDFRAVMCAIYLACLFRINFENVCNIGPRVLRWRESELIGWVGGMTGLPIERIQAIASTLIFKDEGDWVTVAHKPFIHGVDRMVFLSPHAFVDVVASHSMLAAINALGEIRKFYENKSSAIADIVVKEIARDIRMGCLQGADVIVDRKFVVSKSECIQPDLVIVSADRSEVLVVDVKNANPPLTAGDVAKDLKTWKKEWWSQIDRYVTAFTSYPEMLSQHLPGVLGRSPRVYGMLLLRWPFPVPAVVPPEYAAIDWPTLHENLAANAVGRSIQSMHEWIRLRPDCKVARSVRQDKRRIQVGEWTYEVPVQVPDDGSDQS